MKFLTICIGFQTFSGLYQFLQLRFFDLQFAKYFLLTKKKGKIKENLQGVSKRYGECSFESDTSTIPINVLNDSKTVSITTQKINLIKNK